MGKLTAEQTQQLKDLENLRDSADDDETVVWVRKGDHETRLTGERARRWLAANGYDTDDADDSSQAAPLPAKTAAPAKKAVPAKKTATPAAGPESLEDDGNGAALEQDASARPKRDWF